ncbi:MAG: DEAD/DEAH box helicase [Candidatus Bipolaricaulota bacterium]|nr:DEAD/DEAH box helicase [Candidatus Bipolaricaulota bacterium]MDW8126171.1 DEAD/DEAH box helicase [Candidatus Bipolaricaulota bacterium]
MAFEELLRDLVSQDWYAGQIVATFTLPGKAPNYAESRLSFHPAVQGFLERQGIRLFTHQAKAAELILAGEHVFITTPTASGKTLAFNLPVLSRLLADKEATALYLYPLKALTQDQLLKLRELEAGVGFSLRPEIYDGDTPSEVRPRIRAQARILLTNPYALHQYLPWHHKWARFLRNLRFVVIDEAHHYRGVFGSHVALLLRRLRRILARYGAKPQFILASATIANPEEHGERLIGQPVAVVKEDGAPRGEKTFVFWNPFLDTNTSWSNQVASLMAFLIGEGLQTLCFATSRRLAEVLATQAQAKLPGKRVMAYRAGYLPEERRAIERGIREGEIHGVVSTNALELGVDVGGLDAVILGGYPGSIISVWQQAGRAGRGPKPALVFVVGQGDPLDQYFLRHPEELLTRPHEHAIINPKNGPILFRQLLCAAGEFPLTTKDLELFGAEGDVAHALLGSGLVAGTPVGLVYAGTVPAVELVNLNNLSDRTIRIEVDGETLETMDYERALREAHPGAVLLHQGTTYLVRELDLGEGVARCVWEEVDYYTEPLICEDVRILRALEERRYGNLQVGLGEVRVTQAVRAYRMRRAGVTLGVEELSLPPVEFDTEGVWFALPRELARDLGPDLAGALHGAEHALVAIAPLHALADRWDFGGLSTPFHPDLTAPAVIIHETFPNGVGLAHKLFSVLEEWLKAAADLLETCPCQDGCPSCVLSPRCGNENEPMSKNGAAQLLRYLAESLVRPR